MNSITSRSTQAYLVLGVCCAALFIATSARAQYNTYDSDSNSDSDGGSILSNANLGKLVRGSAYGRNGAQLRNLHNSQQQQQQQLAASRNLYNRHQALQHAPSQHDGRQFGADLAGYGALGEPSGRVQAESSNNDQDEDDGGANFGPANFGANFDADGGESSGADGERGAAPMNLNQAASGYPDHDGYGAEFANFGGPSSSSGYGGPSDGAEFGPSFGAEPRRAKSASSLMGSRNYGSDDDAGAPQYGPNSAVDASEADDEGRAGSGINEASSNDNNNDDDE